MSSLQYCSFSISLVNKIWFYLYNGWQGFCVHNSHNLLVFDEWRNKHSVQTYGIQCPFPPRFSCPIINIMCGTQVCERGFRNPNNPIGNIMVYMLNQIQVQFMSYNYSAYVVLLVKMLFPNCFVSVWVEKRKRSICSLESVQYTPIQFQHEIHSNAIFAYLCTP